MANLDEIIGEILAMKEQAERVQSQAAAASRQAEETQQAVAALAGQSLAGVAMEAYERLGVAAREANDAAGAATGAVTSLEAWIGIIASAAGGGY